MPLGKNSDRRFIEKAPTLVRVRRGWPRVSPALRWKGRIPPGANPRSARLECRWEKIQIGGSLKKHPHLFECAEVGREFHPRFGGKAEFHRARIHDLPDWNAVGKKFRSEVH